MTILEINLLKNKKRLIALLFEHILKLVSSNKILDYVISIK